VTAGDAELALLAGAAGARGGGGRLPARVAELAEDLAQPVVHFLQDGGPLGQVHVLERGKTLDGRVDPGVAGGGESRLHPF
jgi:hypothetical protein